MLVSKDNILDLIPQRYPMVMIDSLVCCDEKQVLSQLTIREDNIFINSVGLTASGMIENMAQTAAARTGYLLKNGKGESNKKVPVGVIGSIKNFRLYFLPSVGSLLETAITVEYVVMQATVVKGKTEVDGKLAAEGEMQIFLTEDQPEQP